MQMIDISVLTPHPLNLEIYGTEVVDADLLADIEEKGILSPLVVNPNMVIISGHSRWRIAQKLGLTEVPCEIKTFATEQEEALALISYNKTRLKNFVQRMKEIDLEKKTRQANKQGTSFDVMVAATSMSKGSYHRETFLWNAAKTGDEKAIKLVERIKSDERYTPAKAYNDLLEYRNAEKVKIARKTAAKLGEVLANVEVLHAGDFTEALAFIPDGTVDAIITDPPYPFDFIDCWKALGDFAMKKLRPGGWLVAYSGQANLPEVFKRLESSGLKYYWTQALYHNGTKQDVWGIKLNVMWKPIIVYCKPPVMIIDSGHDDYIISEKEEKIGHSWQQSESSVAKLIETYTKEGDFIVEPFAGSGTTLVVAHRLNRKVIGAELNMDSYNIAKARLKEAGL